MGFRIIWGHEMLKRAAAHGLTSPYQYGACNGHMAISCILLKHMSYDIIHLMQLVASIFDNDATACYYRMIPSQCMIVTACAGVNEDAIKVKLNVLSHMKYFVKTAFGISIQFFMHGIFRKVLSLLQGSTNGGAIWSLIWSVLFAALDNQFCKAHFPSPHKHVYTKCNGEGFVDDTTLWETSKHNSIETVIARMEEKAQTWECNVFVSGGALNLKKNFWYAISWKWRKNGQPVMRMISDDPDLKIHMTSRHNRKNPRLVSHVKSAKVNIHLVYALPPLEMIRLSMSIISMKQPRLIPTFSMLLLIVKRHELVLCQWSYPSSPGLSVQPVSAKNNASISNANLWEPSFPRWVSTKQCPWLSTLAPQCMLAWESPNSGPSRVQVRTSSSLAISLNLIS